MANTLPTIDHSFNERLHDLIELYSARIARGEEIRPDLFAAEHPQFEQELKRYLPAVAVLAELSISSVDSIEHSPTTSNELTSHRILGDFRIGRELGRGGMGIVYEAEQISIGRMVALKVLPFAAVLDDKQITRFKNEARAAGTLNHPNIVPVFAVGEERGVYYYAMSLIRGQSIADVIAEMKKRECGETKDLIPATDLDDETQPIANAAISTQRNSHPVGFSKQLRVWGCKPPKHCILPISMALFIETSSPAIYSWTQTESFGLPILGSLG